MNLKKIKLRRECNRPAPRRKWNETVVPEGGTGKYLIITGKEAEIFNQIFDNDAELISMMNVVDDDPYVPTDIVETTSAYVKKFGGKMRNGNFYFKAYNQDQVEIAEELLHLMKFSIIFVEVRPSKEDSPFPEFE